MIFYFLLFCSFSWTVSKDFKLEPTKCQSSLVYFITLIFQMPHKTIWQANDMALGFGINSTILPLVISKPGFLMSPYKDVLLLFLSLVDKKN